MNIKKYFIQWKQHHKKLMNRMKKNDIAINITLGSIAIIIISLSISNVFPLSATAKENLKKHDILIKMIEMDDMAHQRRKEIINTLGSGYNKTRDRIFQIADNAYHTAQGENDKFKATVKLHDLIIEQNTLLLQLGKISIEEMERCNQLEKEIEQLIKK